MDDLAVSGGRGDRFAFGRNWQHFLAAVDETRIVQAEESIKELLGLDTLDGKTFLDIGSGSGLFSLAARRLGARVHSFDFDPLSVDCAAELKRRYFPDDPSWTMEQGSVLDKAYLESLGGFDVVYSWGVLHHTGSMWEAIGNALKPVKQGGKAAIAVYNDPGDRWDYWIAVKKTYNKSPALRPILIAVHAPYLFLGRFLVRAITGRLVMERGMSLWHDMLDWLGGYPFETARPEQVFGFCREKGFTLVGLKTCGRSGRGNNQFVFERTHEG